MNVSPIHVQMEERARTMVEASAAIALLGMGACFATATLQSVLATPVKMVGCVANTQKEVLNVLANHIFGGLPALLPVRM